jgi:hypothetical protein
MKKLLVESHLPTDVKTAWELFESDRFRDRLAQQTGIHSEVLSERQEGSVVVRRMKYVSGRDLPAIAATALGAKRLAYEQTNRLDLANSRLDWSIDLPVVGDRVTVSGVTTMEPAPGGCKRKVEGTIEVRMRLIGGQIENAVVGEFEKSMEKVVELARELLREDGRG